MRISINNFKSIKNLHNYDILPLTIISGVNSSGKSSFIQLLLLLKQTIDLESSRKALVTDGDFYKVREFKDILYNKNIDNKLEISFELNKESFSRIAEQNRYQILETYPDYSCLISLKYDVYDDREYIQEFSVKITLPKGSKREQYINVFTTQGKEPEFSIETNTGLFSNSLYFNKPAITNIIYTSIYPIYCETFSTHTEKDPHGEEVLVQERSKEFIEFGGIKALLDAFFKSISYIGPLREQPKDEYITSRTSEFVGTKGEHVAQVLKMNSSKDIHFFKILETEEGIEYQPIKSNLLSGVKYWMCEVFKIAQDIDVEKEQDRYTITLVNESGLKTTIKHVGFGISQLLPIVVEALNMDDKGILLLEQPEIHLHPKLQSLLFDFLYSLTLQGKTIIIETHSDHFITRMRRRVAEDTSNSMNDKINLTFIESYRRNNIFRTISLDDLGTLSYFPDDFVEQTTPEHKAIVKAQMKKRVRK